MKKLFDKINKIVFVIGMVAILALVLIAMCYPGDTINGIWGTISFICFLLIFILVIFLVISVVLAFIEGLKKDKTAFLKKVVLNILWFAVAYIVVYILDCVKQSEISTNINLGKAALQILVSAVGIVGGEYMLTSHKE